MRKILKLIRICDKSLEIDITKQTRDRQYVYARFCYFHYARKITNLSLASIGENCDGRDHATALYGIKKYNELIKYDDFQRIDKQIATNIPFDMLPKGYIKEFKDHLEKYLTKEEICEKENEIDYWKRKALKLEEHLSRITTRESIKTFIEMPDDEYKKTDENKFIPILKMRKYDLSKVV